MGFRAHTYRDATLRLNPVAYWRQGEQGNQRVAVDQMGAQPPNLVTNPSFEADLAGWSTGSNWSVAQSTAQALYGAASALITRLNTSQGNGFLSYGLSLAPNTTYTWSIYGKLGTGQAGPYRVNAFGNVSGLLALGSNTNLTAGGWARMQVTFTTGPSDTSVTVFVNDDGISSPTSGNTAYFDGAQLTQTAVLQSFYEGNGGNDGDYIGSFTPNLVGTPLDANSSAGWSTAGDGFFLNSGATATIVSSPTPQVGSNALKLVKDALLADEGAWFAIGTLASGTTYTLSAYFRGNAGGESADVVIGNGTQSATASATTLTNTGWTRISVSITPTSTLTGSHIAIRCKGVPANTIFVNAVQVTQTPNVVPYSDTQGVTLGQGGSISGDGDTSVLFDGQSGYISTSTQYASPGPQGPFTLEAWVNTTASGGVFGFVGSGADRLVYVGTDGKVYFGIYHGGFVTINSPSAINNGAWHHVVATLAANNNMSLYEDGVLVASNSNTAPPQSFAGYWFIGKIGGGGWPAQPGNNFAGTIDEPAIYNYALPAREIFYKYLSGAGTFKDTIAYTGGLWLAFNRAGVAFYETDEPRLANLALEVERVARTGEGAI